MRQLAGGSEGRSNAVVHWTEADRLLIDRRKGIKIKLPIDRQLNNNNIDGSSIDKYFIKLGTMLSKMYEMEVINKRLLCHQNQT